MTNKETAAGKKYPYERVVAMKKQLTAVTCLLLIGTAGCLANPPAEEGRHNDKHHPNYSEMRQSINEPADHKRQRLTSQNIAKHLVGVAEKVPNVRDATAIVTMGYAVVGIDIDKDVDRSKVGTIKYSVAEALRNDRYGANAIVVSDPDTVQRLKNMGKSIKDGSPVSGIFNQLADIVGRVVPQIPGDMRNPGRKQQSDQPEQKRQMPGSERRKLQQQQNNGTQPGENRQSPNRNAPNRNPKQPGA
ncbi:MAG TPA: YhcN/YlaJ family sporulation lipoprotein [Bacillales bacterium]|nr:YhcN/YlaJ family sporulation lipoprotein [Bacillales bacterium]